MVLFYRQHPAVLLAISFLCGLNDYLYPWSLPFSALWLLYLCFLGRMAAFQGICLLGLGWLYIFSLYSEAPRGNGSIQGIFSIRSLQPHSSPFHKDLLYKGVLYLPNGVPCSMTLPETERLLADRDYWISGTLFERGLFQYTLKPQEHRPLTQKTWGLAERRYQWKETFRTSLQKNLSPRSASLLASLATGDVEDRLLRYEFSRTGLQHLLAISGFHFALLVAFISGCLKTFLPQRSRIYLLLAALSLYFLFVGSAPAILRSFCTALLYFFGKLLNKEAPPLNLLGGCILIELLLDPLATSQISFQLSFVSCAGLLLLFPLFDQALQKFLPKRCASQLQMLTPLSSFGYIICSLFRKSLGLTLAVNLTLLPLLLYHFHTFPLLGLIYNLFFPLAISAALFLLLMSLSIYAVYSPLSKPLFWILDQWTSFLLELISYPPLLLNHSWNQSNIPGWIYPYYLFGLFGLAIYVKRSD